MRKIGSFLALLSGTLVILIALASLIWREWSDIWKLEFTSQIGFFYTAVVLAVLIAVLGFLAFSTKPRLLGGIILCASFAGIIVGSTFTDIAMLLGVCGGFMLFSLDKENAPGKASEQNPEEGAGEES